MQTFGGVAPVIVAIGGRGRGRGSGHAALRFAAGGVVDFRAAGPESWQRWVFGYYPLSRATVLQLYMGFDCGTGQSVAEKIR